MTRIIDRDIVAALVLFVVGGVALTQMGTGMQNWIFPQVLTYLILLIGAVLVLRVVFAAALKRAPDIMRVTREQRGMVIDVVVFCAIVLAYVLVLDGLGFWLASFLMLSVASIYLTPNKTARNVTMAIAVPLITCIVAYVIFLHVFYVPVPEATWWAGF
ncbi:MAG TPA: tripartite tricarboxylate transporter TctB family protein [Pseudolabrys sp.]|nr:tripartite tricarboxylate transporter TctB family protein [Pseudolabrys sp.]